LFGTEIVYFKFMKEKVKVDFVRTLCNWANASFINGIITSGLVGKEMGLSTVIKTSGYWFENICTSCELIDILLNLQHSRKSSFSLHSFQPKEKVLFPRKYCENGNPFIIRHSLRSKKEMTPCVETTSVRPWSVT
jgi:hypothetical protein